MYIYFLGGGVLKQISLMSCQRLLQTKAVVKNCFIGYVF